MATRLDWRIVSAGAAILAGLIADRLLNRSWQAATGKPAPTDPEQPDTRLRDAVLFAVLSGAIIAVARLLAVRGAAKLYGDALPKALHQEQDG